MFDYIEGGVEDERGLERNAAAFHKHQLLPRYLVDVSKRDQTQTIFGRTFSSPFGISPTGGVGLYQRRGGGPRLPAGGGGGCCWPRRRATRIFRTSCPAAAIIQWKKPPGSRRTIPGFRCMPRK